MFCSRCGKQVPDDSLFCRACGYKFPVDESIDSNTFADGSSSNLNSASPNPTTPIWYYYEGNIRRGPITATQMSELIRNGSVNRETVVWREGLNNWQKIEYTELNSILLSVMPPVPISAISDKWLWALATIPLFCSLIFREFVSPDNSWVITLGVIVLNIIFLFLDINSLEKHGITASKWLWFGFILVPVYLFVRASKTTKNNWPGVAWILIWVSGMFISLSGL